MTNRSLSPSEQREVLHTLMHASASLKTMAKTQDVGSPQLTRFLAQQIDDWCLTAVRHISPPVIREPVNDTDRVVPLRALSVVSPAQSGDVA